MRKAYPFVIGGGLLFYFLDEVHVVNTSIKFGDLTGDFTTDATIGWTIGVGLIVMAVKLTRMVFSDREEVEEAQEEYEEYEDEEVYQQPVKITWWNDYYTDEAPKKSWLNDNWED